MSSGYFVGIDLGTSNSAVAYSTAEGASELLPVVQVSAPGATCELPLLPSALYIPYEGELPPGSAPLPWSAKDALPDHVVGIWARERGVLTPERLVSSAKSWLANPHVDRKAPILPWGSDITEPKRSPFAVSRCYLEHLKKAFAEATQGHDLADSQVVLTVPASFDEVARNLTHQAATEAGLGRVTLLEEPQAAFYAWLDQAGETWRKQIGPGDLVLVCDVGGGTTDLSLIMVTETEGELRLVRVSVGEHLLLGGDNMDLALAYALRAQLEQQGTTIDQWQFQSLVHSARIGKEKLLSDLTLAEVPISVPSRGSRLIAKTISTKLSREQVLGLLVEGFFPLTPITAMPAQRKALGIKEYGLSFAADPAISKHIARFLTRSLQNVKSDPALAELLDRDALSQTALMPTAVLFNGGVFNAKALQERILKLLEGWRGSPVKELVGANLDLAVAKGAAYFSRTILQGHGVRIKAGAARSYYLGLEPTVPAVPGFVPPIKGLCVVPQGLEEGSELELENEEFGLVTGEPVEFRFFSSDVRAGDQPGTIVADAERELEETTSLRLTLPPLHADKSEGEVVPVKLDAVLTDVGTLELWMRHTQSDRRWNLEFNVRTE